MAVLHGTARVEPRRSFTVTVSCVLVCCLWCSMAGVVQAAGSDSSCDIDIENTLRTLLSNQEMPSMQVQALRRDLLRKIQEILEQKALEDEETYYKRSLAALAASNNLPGSKRNLEALARNGYIKTLPDSEEDANYKRSIANLAKNGQFPMNHEEPKRGIASLARNGDLRPPRKDMQELLDDLYGKRNIASLARNYELPHIGNGYKRNIASIARTGKYTGKRSDSGTVQRSKRQADYYENEEYSQPVYQNVLDYDDLIQDLNTPVYDVADKRFLGSVARSGWFRSPTGSRSSRFTTPGKRHIGALARLGWLPSFRNIRRFNRSGRSSNDNCREATANGEAEVNANAQDSSVPIDGHRYYYYNMKPTTDDISLRQIFFHPRSH